MWSEESEDFMTGAKSNDASLKVGVIGAGRIGLPIAARIAQSGLATRVVDVAEDRLSEARERGLQASADMESLLEADVVLAVVAKPAQVFEVLQGEPFVSGRMAGSVFVVVSTVGPAAIRDVLPLAQDCGVVLVDCPVTGGVDRAEAGELTLFVSGAADAAKTLQPVLAPLGSAVDCGDRPGDGQSFKMVNNMLAVTNLLTAAEALAFAAGLGLDCEKLLEVLPKGTAASWMLADRGQRLIGPAGDRRDASIYLDILAKDAGLVLETAEAIGFTAPLAEVVNRQWQKAVAMGFGRHDDTAIIDTYAPLRKDEPAGRTM